MVVILPDSKSVKPITEIGKLVKRSGIERKVIGLKGTSEALWIGYVWEKKYSKEQINLSNEK